MNRVRARLQAAGDAFGANLQSPGLRRAQLAFGAMWAGEWAATVTISVIAYRAGGAAAVGLVAVIRMVPAALIAPLAAALADRHRRDAVLVVVGLLRAAALAGAAGLVAAEAGTAAVYGLVAVATVVQTLYRPAHSALLPALCRTPGELTSANVVRGLLDSLAALVGPLAAAALIASSGTVVALAACAAASLVSALLVVRLPYEAPPRLGEAGGDGREVLAGLALIAWNPSLRLLTALGTAQTFLRGCVSVLVVVVAIDLLGGSDADVGLLSAAVGVGAVLGSLLASMVSWRGRLARCLGGGVALWGAPLTVLAGVPEAAAALVLLAFVGIGNALVDVGAFTLLARLSPERSMARVFAAFEGVLTLGVALGAGVTPLILDAVGPRGALLALGLVGPAATIAAWRRLGLLDAHVAGRDDDIALLQQVPMLAVLPEPTIEHLASGVARERVAPGAAVFREGEPGTRFYVIASGRAEVSQAAVPLRTLGPGDGFGEIALLRPDAARTATVRATADAALDLLAVEEDRFTAAVVGFSSSAVIAEAVVADRLGESAPAAGSGGTGAPVAR
jgi:Na+/melibiose symporter-like transporter